MLEREGAEVKWERSEEERGLEGAAQAVVVSIVAAGAYDAIKAALNRFRERVPRTEVEMDPDDG